jgi:hypothetical protein
MEAQKAVLEQIAIRHSNWAERHAANTEAAILYLLLHTECLTREQQDE